MDASDSILLNQYARSGDQSAFAQLVASHADWVYSAALRLVRDVHLAEDVTQAVFLLLAQNAAKLKDRPVNAWLFKVTQYCAANAMRSAQRRQRHERKAAMLKSDSSNVNPEPLWEEMAPLLEESVGRLRGEDRQALLLRFYQRKSMAELGVAMGVSEDAAKKRVAKAVERLRSNFASKGVLIPVIAVAVTLLTEQTTHAAPAGLIAGCVPGGASASAAQIAQGVRHMLYLTKLKLIIVAVLVLALLPTGLWMALRAAGPEAPPAPPVAPVAVPAAAPPATQPDLTVAAADGSIAPFCNANTQMLVSFNFAAMDPDAIGTALQTCLLENADPTDTARHAFILKSAAAMRIQLTRWTQSMIQAGCQREYLLAEQRGDNPDNIVGMFAVPIAAQSDVLSLDSLLGHSSPGIDSADGHARIYGAKPDVTVTMDAQADPILPTALSAAGDGAVRVAIHPAVLKYSGPMPALMGLGDLAEPEWNAVTWASLAVVPPPDCSSTVILQCQDAASAAALAKLIQTKFAALKDSPPAISIGGKSAPEVERMIAPLAPLLAQVKQTVNGSRVNITFDKPTTEMLLMIWYRTELERAR